jgi:predicted phosphoribosyltransferase
MFSGFRDRREAGRVLAQRLATSYAGRQNLLVLALPRGGVPVGYEVATALAAPLDVFLVRKLGVPGHEEFAMGAIAGGGIRLVNTEVVRTLEIDETLIDAVIEREERELARREALYRGNGAGPSAANRTVILVDDGLATGSTMQVAVTALRAQRPARIVVAVPIAARPACEALSTFVDEIVCVETPEPLHAVGFWYEDFTQTSDEQVCELLQLSRAPRPLSAERERSPEREPSPESEPSEPEEEPTSFERSAPRELVTALSRP